MAAGAATAAAAASQAAAAVLTTTEAFRRTDLLRTLVQKPDVYKPTTRDQEIETWSDWKHGLKNYLSVVDTKYVEEMEVIESDPSRPSTISTMADDTKRRARELYSILVSFMRGRPAKLARAITDQNGYEVWRTFSTRGRGTTRTSSRPGRPSSRATPGNGCRWRTAQTTSMSPIRLPSPAATRSPGLP